MIESVKEQVSDNTKGIADVNDKIMILRSELNKNLKSITNNIKRSKNVIIYGLEDTDEINKDLDGKIGEILNNIGLNMQHVDSSNRIGKKAGKKPVIISLVSQKQKKNFFSNINLFRSLGLSIANDSTKEERQYYNKMKEVKSELLKLGIESKIVKSKIEVEGNPLNLEEAYEFLEGKGNGNNNNNDMGGKNDNAEKRDGYSSDISGERKKFNEREKEKGYSSDTSSTISNLSSTSRKRVR